MEDTTLTESPAGHDVVALMLATANSERSSPVYTICQIPSVRRVCEPTKFQAQPTFSLHDFKLANMTH